MQSFFNNNNEDEERQLTELTDTIFETVIKDLKSKSRYLTITPDLRASLRDAVYKLVKIASQQNKLLLQFPAVLAYFVYNFLKNIDLNRINYINEKLDDIQRLIQRKNLQGLSFRTIKQMLKHELQEKKFRHSRLNKEEKQQEEQRQGEKKGEKQEEGEGQESESEESQGQQGQELGEESQEGNEQENGENQGQQEGEEGNQGEGETQEGGEQGSEQEGQELQGGEEELGEEGQKSEGKGSQSGEEGEQEGEEGESQGGEQQSENEGGEQQGEENQGGKQGEGGEEEEEQGNENEGQQSGEEGNQGEQDNVQEGQESEGGSENEGRNSEEQEGQNGEQGEGQENENEESQSGEEEGGGGEQGEGVEEGGEQQGEESGGEGQESESEGTQSGEESGEGQNGEEGEESQEGNEQENEEQSGNEGNEGEQQGEGSQSGEESGEQQSENKGNQGQSGEEGQGNEIEDIIEDLENNIDEESMILDELEESLQKSLSALSIGKGSGGGVLKDINPRVLELLERANRVLALANHVDLQYANRGVKDQGGVMKGITTGNNVKHMFKSQLVLPDEIFLERYTNRSLLQRAVENEGVGDLYFMIDKSGSMGDEMPNGYTAFENVSAVALASAMEAEKNNKKVFVQYFDYSTTEPLDVNNVFEIAQIQPGGGTDMMVALRKFMEYYNNYPGLKDVKQIFILSDFATNYDNPTLYDFRNFARNNGLVVTCIHVYNGEVPDEMQHIIDEICDEYYKFNLIRG